MGRKVVAHVVPEKRITVSGIRLPDPIPDGEILTDVKNNQWKIGRSIGFGGFGEIYLASEYPPSNCRGNGNGGIYGNGQYVIKVEPHLSSTLFVEMNFYLRAASEEKVNDWKEYYDQKVLGMPHLVSFGSHYFHEKLRFLVLPRYGCDVQKKFYELGRRFHPKTAFTLCYYIIDILEYIHSHGYVHNDIKASNLVLGQNGQAPVYLMDFGLACSYTDKYTGLHKPYCEDFRRAHNGTLEYTSRDGHCGAVSRKGDLEILGYNLLQWLVGYLPWEMDLSDPERVATLKKRAMNHINDFVSRCYIKDSPPGALIDYLKYINSLKFDSIPDYKYCRKLFRLGVQQCGYKFDKVLSFDPSTATPLTKVKSIKRLQSEIENIIDESPRKIFIINNSIKTPELRIPCNVQDFNRITRHSATESQILSNKRFDWVKVLQSNPEQKLKNLKKEKMKKRLLSEKSCDNLTCDELINSLKLNNPTYVMLQQMEKMRQRQLAEQTITEDTMMDTKETNNNINNSTTNNNKDNKQKKKKTTSTSLSSTKRRKSTTIPTTNNNSNTSTLKTLSLRNLRTRKTTTSSKLTIIEEIQNQDEEEKNNSKKNNKTLNNNNIKLQKTKSNKLKKSSPIINSTTKKSNITPPPKINNNKNNFNNNSNKSEERGMILNRNNNKKPKRLNCSNSNSSLNMASPLSTKNKTINYLNKKLILALQKISITGDKSFDLINNIKNLEYMPRRNRSQIKLN